METPKVSIIVPAYNAAPYIGECLGSIAAQTWRDIEVVVVDDASTDDTAAEAADFCSGDPRFRIVRAQHGGVSAARNLGIECAVGEWIGFVDADDCLYPFAVERLMETARASDADVSVGIIESGKRFRPETGRSEASPIVWNYSEAMQESLYQTHILNSPCGMLMKRSLLGQRRFREGIRYEDLDAYYRFYEGARRIAWLPERVYFYRRNSGSFINTWNSARLDVLDVTDRLLDYMRGRYPELVRAAEDRRFSAHFNMLLLMLRHGSPDPGALDRCRRVIGEYRSRTLADPRVRLKNKLGALASYGGLPLLRLLSKLA